MNGQLQVNVQRPVHKYEGINPPQHSLHMHMKVNVSYINVHRQKKWNKTTDQVKPHPRHGAEKNLTRRRSSSNASSHEYANMLPGTEMKPKQQHQVAVLTKEQHNMNKVHKTVRQWLNINVQVVKHQLRPEQCNSHWSIYTQQNEGMKTTQQWTHWSCSNAIHTHIYTYIYVCIYVVITRRHFIRNN